MNNEIQRKKINRFLKGKNHEAIDAFCIYQWIDRCHFEGWWDDAVALGSFIPPNSLSLDYQKRIEFLLGQCRNQISQRKDQFVEIRNSNDKPALPIPKAFIDVIEELGLKLEGRGRSRMKLKYFNKRLLFLEKITFETCTFYFTDRSCESLLTWFEKHGFEYLTTNMTRGSKNIDERHPRVKLSWDDATALIPIIFTQEYLDKIKKAATEKVHESSPPSKWNQFGHRIGSQAAKIDDLLLVGASIADIASIIGSTVQRVKGHLIHLGRDKGITLTFIRESGIYRILPENIPEVIKKSSRNKDTKEIQLNFWCAFKEFVSENQSILKIRKVYPRHWLNISFGYSYCHICMTINIKSTLMTCELYINNSKDLFQKLIKKRDIIEREVGETLQWNELPKRKASRIKLIHTADLSNQDNWKEYFTWLKEKSEKFQNVFSRYV